VKKFQGIYGQRTNNSFRGEKKTKEYCICFSIVVQQVLLSSFLKNRTFKNERL
jgi:hypothetical protein